MTKFVRDVWLVFIRQVALILRNPVWLVVGVMQPLMFLLLFGPLIKRIPVPGVGGGDAYRFFVPGLLVQLAMFGTLFVGFALIAELRRRGRDQGGAVPAVAMSAYARPEDRDRALAAGFQRYLAKPVDVLELMAVVGVLHRERAT